jgi:hypothetical protein
MTGWFAAHKVAVLIGAALIAGAILLLRSKRAGADGGYPVNPYSLSPPSQGAGDSGIVIAPGRQALPINLPAGSSTGPGAGPTVAQPFADVAGDIGSSALSFFIPDAPPPPQPILAAAAFSPAELASQPQVNEFGATPQAFTNIQVATPQEAQPGTFAADPQSGGIFSTPNPVGTSGTITYDPGVPIYTTVQPVPGSYSFDPIYTGGGTLVDASGHVVNAKGARVGGATLDT